MPKWMLFCKPEKKVVYATIDDLNALEHRLLTLILEVATGDKDKIAAATATLTQSASALQDAVNKNK